MNSELDLSKKCILYIDDNAASIEAALAIFEDDYNYAILSELTVEEGLETLENYYGTIDAIILDLSFPDSKLQGKEGLQIIKEKYGWIPVFVLTGSTDPEEQATAQECLSLGAEQVFHKAVFDVGIFMDQVTDAAHREHLSTQLRQSKDYTSKQVTLPAIHVTNFKTYSNGVFVYKLETLLVDLKSDSYTKWIIELTKMIHLFRWAELTQKFVNEKGKINCYYQFTLAGDDEAEVLYKFNELHYNISSFFNNSLIYQPAAFIPLTDIDRTLNVFVAGRFKKPYQLYCFDREHKYIENNQSGIGFKSSAASQELSGVSLRYQTNDDTFDVLFHHLINIPGIVIQHTLRPIVLEIDEIDVLHKASQQFTDELSKPFKEAAQHLLLNQSELFALSSSCLLPSKQIGTILTLASNLFYGGIAKPVLVDQDEFFESFKKFSRLKYLVTANELSHTVKLPVVHEDFQTHFKIDGSSNQYVTQLAYKKDNVALGEKFENLIGIESKQFQKHTYIIGKTGTGKTSVLKTMIQNRMESGDGLALIDPHGDIYKKVIEQVPDHRKKDIILFDPTDPKNEFGFNFFNYNKDFPEQQGFIVSELIKIFDDIYNLDKTGGPMFELYFKNAAYLAMDTIENPSLDDIARIFQDEKLLEHCLSKSKNSRVISFFRAAQEASGEMSLSNFTNYIASKLTRFTDNPLLRNVLCDPEKDVDFRKLMDDGKILLVKLNKGRLGSEGVGFIGRLLFNKLIMSAYTRENIPEEKRREFSIFIDEFQNFTSGDIISALGEVRKYKLQLILANQTFAQLPEHLAQNILGNVGSLITAAVSPYDAEMIAPFLEPEFTKQDIVHLDNYKFILSTQYNNKRVAPFIFNSIPY